MNTIKSLGFVGLAAAGLFAAQAFATTCPVGTQGSPVCVATSGGDGPGTSLADILAPNTTTNLNGIFTAGSPSVNPYTQQVQKPFWSVAGSSGSVSTILLQLAGNANGYTFGIFDPTNPTNKLDIFSSKTSGSQALLSVYTGGGYAVNLGTKMYFGTTNYFGFFLTDPNGGVTFYSLPSLNESSTTYPGGTPHMVAYQGNNVGTIRAMNGLAGGQWQSSEYIQAWEDMPFGSSDLDYNDFVVLVESVHPVPEPAVLGMFGLGVLLLGGFAALRRRGWKA